VLAKQIPLQLHEYDIFTNVVGGVKVTEPAADLAVAVAIASSYHSAPAASNIAFIGEIGLNGELRTVSQLVARLHEASKLGFTQVMLPKMRRQAADVPRGLQLVEVSDLNEALAAAFAGAAAAV
jgi:DNA repair protein RadA/Sms